MTPQELLSKLAKARPSGKDSWIACCPAHEDNTPSLSIKVSGDGKILMKCHAGCATEAICSAVGITMKDLMGQSERRPSKTPPVLVATYDYKDAHGDLLFQKLRYAPKDFRIRRPDPDRKGEWLWGLGQDTPHGLYRVRELLDAILDERPVFFVEGEKDVDTLAKAGFAATCNPCGASEKWQDYNTPVFTNSELTIVADKDEPGREFAKSVSVGINGVAKSLQIVEMPDRNGKKVKDVTDWFEAGGTAVEFGEFVRNPPGNATEQCWSVKDLVKFDVSNDTNAVIGLHDGKATRYLCRSYPAWLIGQSGIGKSSLGMQMCFFWAANRNFAGIYPVRDGLRVLIVQNENDIGDCAEVTQGILDGASFTTEQFDMINERVKIIRCRGKTGAAFCRWLDHEVTAWHADIAYIDPLLRYAGIDVSRQDQCTKFLNDSLDPVLANTGVVMIGAHHTGKPKDKRSTLDQTIYDRMYSGIGSSELVNWARAVTIIDALKDGTFEMLLSKRGNRAWATHPKDDLPTTSIYLRHAVGRIFWEQIEPPLSKPQENKGAKAGRPNKIMDVATMNLHSFCAACTNEGEGLNIIATRLEAWLAKERKDVGITTCKKVISALVENGKLIKNANALYLKGPEA